MAHWECWDTGLIPGQAHCLRIWDCRSCSFRWNCDPDLISEAPYAMGQQKKWRKKKCWKLSLDKIQERSVPWCRPTQKKWYMTPTSGTSGYAYMIEPNVGALTCHLANPVTDIELWWRERKSTVFYCRAHAKRRDSFCSKDPNFPMIFREEFLKAKFWMRPVGCMTFFWLAGDEATRWCSRTLILHWKLPSSSWVGSLVPIGKLRDTLLCIPLGEELPLCFIPLLLVDCFSFVSASSPPLA